jgi:hypothetical protein
MAQMYVRGAKAKHHALLTRALVGSTPGYEAGPNVEEKRKIQSHDGIERQPPSRHFSE